MPKNATVKNIPVTNIAIVDADYAVRESVARTFSSNRYAVLEFESHEQLLDGDNVEKLHCLILSIEPKHSVICNLIKKLKRQNRYLSVIIIGDDEDFTHAVTSIQAGADEYIYKPINDMKLRALVNEVTEY